MPNARPWSGSFVREISTIRGARGVLRRVARADGIEAGDAGAPTEHGPRSQDLKTNLIPYKNAVPQGAPELTRVRQGRERVKWPANSQMHDAPSSCDPLELREPCMKVTIGKENTTAVRKLQYEDNSTRTTAV